MGSASDSNAGSGFSRTLLATAIACAACGGPPSISTGGHGAYEASLIPIGDGFAVAWYDDRDGNAEIYFRLLDADGRPAGPERRVTNDPEQSYEADIQAVGDRLAIAWYDKAADKTLHARLGVWTKNGQRAWSTTLSGGGVNARNPIVRASGSSLFVAWIEDAPSGPPHVWTAWWDDAGHQTMLPRALAPVGPTTWNLNGAMDAGGTPWVVFDAKAGTKADEIFAAHAVASPTVVRLTDDDGKPSKYPDIVFGGGRAGLTWFDERDGNREVYFWSGAPDDLGSGVERSATRVTRTPGESIGAYVSWNAGRFGLAWNDDSPGQHEIFFEPFDGGGRSLAPARQVTNSRTASLIPSIRPAKSGFALAWNETELSAEGHEAPRRSDIGFAEVP